MKNDKDEELDKLFRNGLQRPHQYDGYLDDDWDRLEAMLDKRDRRRPILYLRPVLSVAAALLVLLMGWWLFIPKKEKIPHTIARTVIRSPKTGSINNIASVNKQAINGSKQTSGVAPKAVEQLTSKTYNDDLRLADKTTKTRIADNVNGKDANGMSSASQGESNKILLVAQNPRMLINTVGLKEAGLPSGNYFEKAAINTALEDTKGNANKITIKRKNGFRPIYAISVVGAPDLNSVGTFQQSKVGTNLGLELAAGISKRFTISTGVLYSDKPYITNFSNYHATGYTFQVDPLNVSANCRMLDIPLNINYLVYNKHLQKLSFGTGLSSYIMLQEDYQFNYASNTVAGPRYYDVPGSNKYFFGVANLNATYERQLSSKVSFMVQPYLKLPITNIGYSQVRLQSTGLAFGVSYNLNTFKKPD